MGMLRTIPFTTAKKKKFVTTIDQTGTEQKIFAHGITRRSCYKWDKKFRSSIAQRTNTLGLCYRAMQHLFYH